MWRHLSSALIVASVAPSVAGQQWSNVPLVKHSRLQAVNTDGSSAYTGGFPIRLRGVVLNDHELWLDPAFVPDPGFGNFNLGGQWEVFVQAIDLDGTDFDPFPTEPFDDFGGTAAWLGQNYAGLPWVPEWMTYSEPEWLAELTRLNYGGGVPGVDPKIRAGDLVELRARGGLAFQGKLNVNEQHNTDPAYDFELVLLAAGFGRPEPAVVTVSDFKNVADEFVFDPTRQTGGERHQGAWVDLRDVEMIDPDAWGMNASVVVMDREGRTLPVRLGRDEAFTFNDPPQGRIALSGVVNQSGGSDKDGYYLIVLQESDVRPAADLNGDGLVNQPDLGILLATYNFCGGDPGYDQRGDINGDGCVDQQDLGILLAAYGH